jgi:hypothetical protein
MNKSSNRRLVTATDPPTWSTWPEAARVILYPPHLRKTITIALVVGTVLFCINQLDIVLRGDATAVVWLKSAVTYLVPLCVSNAGVLVASKVVRARGSNDREHHAARAQKGRKSTAPPDRRQSSR